MEGQHDGRRLFGIVLRRNVDDIGAVSAANLQDADVVTGYERRGCHGNGENEQVEHWLDPSDVGSNGRSLVHDTASRNAEGDGPPVRWWDWADLWLEDLVERHRHPVAGKRFSFPVGNFDCSTYVGEEES